MKSSPRERLRGQGNDTSKRSTWTWRRMMVWFLTNPSPNGRDLSHMILLHPCPRGLSAHDRGEERTDLQTGEDPTRRLHPK